MNLGDADRVVVTTFDASGTPTRSSDFVVPLADDRIAVWTPYPTRWQERLALSEVVSVQAASSLGRPLRSEPVLEGRAEILTSGPDFEAGEHLTREKYGLAVTMADAVDWAWELGGTRTPHAVVVIHVVG